MAILSMEVRSKDAAESWHEDLSLNVPCIVNSALKVEHNKFDDPVAAAMATVDFCNRNLRPWQNSRQVVRVFHAHQDGTQTDIWNGCYPN